jgi:hypothetical protein
MHAQPNPAAMPKRQPYCQIGARFRGIQFTVAKDGETDINPRKYLPSPASVWATFLFVPALIGRRGASQRAVPILPTN